MNEYKDVTLISSLYDIITLIIISLIEYSNKYTCIELKLY